MWTVLTTKEYSPQEMAAFDGANEAADDSITIRALAARNQRQVNRVVLSQPLGPARRHGPHLGQ